MTFFEMVLGSNPSIFNIAVGVHEKMRNGIGIQSFIERHRIDSILKIDHQKILEFGIFLSIIPKSLCI
jgi:hypothetical protein